MKVSAGEEKVVIGIEETYAENQVSSRSPGCFLCKRWGSLERGNDGNFLFVHLLLNLVCLRF